MSEMERYSYLKRPCLEQLSKDNFTDKHEKLEKLKKLPATGPRKVNQNLAQVKEKLGKS